MKGLSCLKVNLKGTVLDLILVHPIEAREDSTLPHTPDQDPNPDPY